MTFRQFAAQGQQQNAILVVRSTDCGRTFSPARELTGFVPYEYVDRHADGSLARDCGDARNACQSGFTFPRNGTLPRSTADQADSRHEWVHIVWEATVPGSVAPTGTTFGSTDVPGEGGQGAIYYARYEQFDGRTVPFAGDYLWISSAGGTTFGTWTDWRDTVPGVDQRETTADETGADVLQCRVQKQDGSLTGDRCPRDGGLDQNIYGDLAP